MTEPTAQVSRTIAASPEAIFRALTSTAEMKRFFFGADVTSTFRVGSPITFSGTYDGEAYEDKGEILVNDPPRRLSFSHYSPLSGLADVPENYNAVTFDLTPAGTSTRVTLTQARLLGGVRRSDRENRAMFEKNWATLLDGLDTVVTGGSSAA
jgi:uncharacterized protein YndB with AHSA1/START domain